MEVLFSRSRYFLPRVQKYLFSEPRLIVQLEFHKSWLYKLNDPCHYKNMAIICSTVPGNLCNIIDA